MKFERAWKVWRAAAQDASRPILTHISVERVNDSETEGIAVAANGFMLAVVPVTLEEGDVPGLVRADLFALAAKMPDRGSPPRGKRATRAGMALGADRVTLSDDSMHLRLSLHGGKELPSFPDWRKFMPSLPGPAEGLVGEIGFDTHFLATAGEVLGVGRGVAGVRLTFNGLTRPVLVERTARFNSASPEPPYAVVMPQTITARLREQKAGAA